MAITKTELVQAMGVFKEEMDKYYVLKEDGKGLSTNDFTDALKEKLDGIIDETVTADDIKDLFNKKAGDGE